MDGTEGFGWGRGDWMEVEDSGRVRGDSRIHYCFSQTCVSFMVNFFAALQFLHGQDESSVIRCIRNMIGLQLVNKRHG